MADKPILFSGPMVRALLAGTKTQTRRNLDAWTEEPVAFVEAGAIAALDENEREYRWPRTHAVGDRLYVREHWRCAPIFDDLAPREMISGQPRYFEADGARTTELLDQDPANGRFRQGMHMPRWASRLTLTVADVRVERLQDISDADALAEGVKPWPTEWFEAKGFCSVPSATVPGRTLYAALWDQINGAGAWSANPWVAAYTFTVERGNIDVLARPV